MTTATKNCVHHHIFEPPAAGKPPSRGVCKRCGDVVWQPNTFPSESYNGKRDKPRKGKL